MTCVFLALALVALPVRDAAAVTRASAAGATGDTLRARTWGFEDDAADVAPHGFSFGRTGGGRPGRWIVRTDEAAAGGKYVLAQTDTDSTDYRFPVAVADGVVLDDLRLSAKCKPVSGKVDQACGLVFRYSSPDDYYLTRANALESNVRLYYVKGGRRTQFASWSGRVTAGVWHELRVDARADHFEVYWDGAKVIDALDRTFTHAGTVGLWTKADSVTYFDDLSAEPLEP